MKKPYLKSIEYIRGVSMLGVVAIHIGSQYLLNPSPNINLVALFEIVSRFSVPIFFFISAFGLFYKIDLNAPFDYKNFLRRRFKAVLIPYLLWSIFYFTHDNNFFAYGLPDFGFAVEVIFFGLAKYQLYFLVILIWFYLLMPIWIKIIKSLTPTKFAIIFFAQIGFNYFSSYNVALFEFTNSLPYDSVLKMFLMWRLNYLVLHYVFVFLLGGILAIHSEKFFAWLKENKILVSVFFVITLAMHLGYFYWLVLGENFSALNAVNTAHQLSPTGFLYTISTSIFLFMIFENIEFSGLAEKFLSLTGKNSYFVYLFHPLAITYLSILFSKFNLVMTAILAIIFYILTILISLFVGISWRNIKTK